MVTGEVRDLVLAYLTEFGGNKNGRVARRIVDTIINDECQNHFKRTKSLHGYWHTVVEDGMNEYLIPDACHSPYYVAVAGERYYPAPYPYIEDAKRSAGGRTRVTENGTTVAAVADRWYWVLGRTMTIYPAPEQDTSTETSGSCTVSGSTVTISSGSLGSNNSLKDYLMEIGSSYFIILSHDDTDVVLDGTPSSTATTYVIYDLGLQIRGVKIPTDLTIGGTDDVPGSDSDAHAIALASAIKVLTMKPRKGQEDFIDVSGLRVLHKEMLRDAINDNLNVHSAPKSVTPWTLRSDHAGNL